MLKIIRPPTTIQAAGAPPKIKEQLVDRVASDTMSNASDRRSKRGSRAQLRVRKGKIEDVARALRQPNEL